MAQTTVTIGQAIDQVLTALESFDDKEMRTILCTVCAHLGVDLGSSAPAIAPQSFLGGEATEHAATKTHRGRSSGAVDIRSLKEQKQPKSAVQMACLVAYYLNEHASDGDKKATVKIEDMEKYFKQGGYKLPQTDRSVIGGCEGGRLF